MAIEPELPVLHLSRQEARLLSRFRQAGPLGITNRVCAVELGILAYAQRIGGLRRKGFKIETECLDAETGHYRYIMTDEPKGVRIMGPGGVFPGRQGVLPGVLP